jgi:hypothetical protein
LGREEKEEEEVLGRFLVLLFLNLVPWAFPNVLEFSW